jgi:hypothetical protein
MLVAPSSRAAVVPAMPLSSAVATRISPPSSVRGVRAPSPWKIAVGALLILIAIAYGGRDIPNNAGGALGVLTAICLYLFGGIALIRSGLRTKRAPSTSADSLESPVASERAYFVGTSAGVFIVGLGALGVIASLVAGSVANVLNMALFIAFGVAVLARHRSAIVFGLAYLSLLAFMTVMHGFIPLEIAQCALVLALVLYVRARV